jgi:hypothetical protein
VSVARRPSTLCRPSTYARCQRSLTLRYHSSVLDRRSLLKRLSAAPLTASALQGAIPPGKVKIANFEIHKVSVRWRDLT